MELYLSMERENSGRADLSAFEQGTSYLNAINTGLFPSRRRLAEALGVSHTWVSKAISVAELPVAIVDCFRSPIDIQPRHAAEITHALEVDPDRVLAAAELLRFKTPRLSAVKTVQHLLSRSNQGSEEAEIKVDGSMIGSFRMSRRGHALVKLDMAAAKQLSLESISNALRRVLHVAREEARKDTK
jgi:ParB family chromosome partitioning protein